VVREDPSDNCRRVRPRSQDRSALDHIATGAVRTGQARNQGSDGVLVHGQSLACDNGLALLAVGASVGCASVLTVAAIVVAAKARCTSHDGESDGGGLP
jgi:hypothetical protein